MSFPIHPLLCLCVFVHVGGVHVYVSVELVLRPDGVSACDLTLQLNIRFKETSVFRFGCQSL